MTRTTLTAEMKGKRTLRMTTRKDGEEEATEVTTRTASTMTSPMETDAAPTRETPVVERGTRERSRKRIRNAGTQTEMSTRNAIRKVEKEETLRGGRRMKVALGSKREVDMGTWQGRNIEYWSRTTRRMRRDAKLREETGISAAQKRRAKQAAAKRAVREQRTNNETDGRVPGPPAATSTPVPDRVTELISEYALSHFVESDAKKREKCFAAV